MNHDKIPSRCISIAERINFPLLALVWFVGIVIGFGGLFNYQNNAGPSGEVPTGIPGGSQIEPHLGRPTLIMFAHPRCPCTHASVGELARLMTKLQGKVHAHVVFHIPETTSPDWGATELVAEARAIPGVRVLQDHGGIETRRFGVKTSGHVLLYDPSGELAFTGGITLARGHEGDNVGSSALLAQVTRSGSMVPSGQVVFGCPILE